MAQANLSVSTAPPLPGLALVSQLNEIHKALSSANSGSTPPNNPHDGFLWLDVSSRNGAKLKVYDQPNSRWITVLNANLNSQNNDSLVPLSLGGTGASNPQQAKSNLLLGSLADLNVVDANSVAPNSLPYSVLAPSSPNSLLSFNNLGNPALLPFADLTQHIPSVQSSINAPTGWAWVSPTTSTTQTPAAATAADADAEPLVNLPSPHTQGAVLTIPQPGAANSSVIQFFAPYPSNIYDAQPDQFHSSRAVTNHFLFQRSGTLSKTTPLSSDTLPRQPWSLILGNSHSNFFKIPNFHARSVSWNHLLNTHPSAVTVIGTGTYTSAGQSYLYQNVMNPHGEDGSSGAFTSIVTNTTVTIRFGSLIRIYPYSSDAPTYINISSGAAWRARIIAKP